MKTFLKTNFIAFTICLFVYLFGCEANYSVAQDIVEYRQNSVLAQNNPVCVYCGYNYQMEFINQDASII